MFYRPRDLHTIESRAQELSIFIPKAKLQIETLKLELIRDNLEHSKDLGNKRIVEREKLGNKTLLMNTYF